MIGSDAVTNSDWHSHSWMNVRELEEVQRRYRTLCKEDDAGNDAELDAIITAMRAADGRQEGRSRLIFCFHD